MKWFKFNIRREARVAAALLVLVLLIAFSERKQDGIDIQRVEVQLKNSSENHFIDEQDVMSLMQLSSENLKGASVSKVNLRNLENRIRNDRFVQDADIYSDLKGNLVVDVILRRPLARIVRSDGPDGYIAEDGTIMPVSDKFTSRVMLVSGSYVQQLLKHGNVNKSEEGNGLMEMIKTISEDDFWRAQVAQLDIDSHANVTIYPQVSGQLVEFGALDNVQPKFRKLKIFYKEILPRMGWNKYKRVNLEYEGQIVAE